ncbi:MAG: FAD-dependent monooxygenase [Oscillospiraceae bacterium]|nr:FAD-dependent monooxygenase [Oscillospiraceae bacterium]
MDRCDVLVVGAGPAGIFTALELKERMPAAAVLLVDKGPALDKRECPARIAGRCAKCGTCRILSGWGGAGAFSDGKLSLSHEVGGHITDYMPPEEADALIQYADRIYTRFGAPQTVYGLGDKRVEEIAYACSKFNIHLVPCPVRHMGTEYSALVLQNMFDYLQSCEGFTFLGQAQAEDLVLEDGCAAGVTLRTAGEAPRTVYAPYIVAAPGRGGAGWLTKEAAAHGIKTANNAVDIGVRVEVPNAVMDALTGALYEAKMVYYSDTFENKVRTFCMNPGGIVSEEHYEGGIAVVNGHSYADQDKRTGNTNFALLVSSRFTEPFDRPIEYGRYIAQLGNMLTGGGIMVQRLGDLLKGRRSDAARLARSTTVPTLKTAVPGDLSFVLPHRHLTSIIEALRAFDHVAPGLYTKDTLLYGVEVKFYSSRLEVDAHFRTVIPGLYAIGDGAGITRGLMQASVTGVAAARDIAQHLEK